MITHLEPDILECEVKWVLGSITTNKASGRDGIPVELFQNLKDDAVRVSHSICQQSWKTQQWPQDWKMSVFIPIPKKGNAKECSNYHTIALISHASKLLKVRWPKYWSFSFSISPPNEYLGLISFRMDWLDLPAVRRLSRVFQKSSSKSSKPGFNST